MDKHKFRPLDEVIYKEDGKEIHGYIIDLFDENRAEVRLADREKPWLIELSKLRPVPTAGALIEEHRKKWPMADAPFVLYDKKQVEKMEDLMLTMQRDKILMQFEGARSEGAERRDRLAKLADDMDALIHEVNRKISRTLGLPDHGPEYWMKTLETLAGPKRKTGLLSNLKNITPPLLAGLKRLRDEHCKRIAGLGGIGAWDVNQLADETSNFFKELGVLIDAYDPLPGQEPDLSQVSDGYHTFAELYEHRNRLYISLCRQVATDEARPARVWKSKLHSDGKGMEGWFVLGIFAQKGKQITYHLPNKHWRECEFAQEMETAHEFDGHTPKDVLERLRMFF